MITLLMSIYSGERPEYFSTALESINSQTDQPEEVLIIKDGPVSDIIENIIKFYQGKMNIRSIQLTKNMGLARALNIGLYEAKYPWIMRFDSDDFSCEDRVARQRKTMLSNKYDLFGSQIAEFNINPSAIMRIRKVPLQHDDIVLFAKSRNPFNHMSVCYKRDLALQCGGYPEIPFMEDYALWIKMLLLGANTMNDFDALVRARVGNGMIKRRGGAKYIKSEIMLQNFMYKNNFKSLFEALFDGFLRSFIFLSPSSFRSLIYRFFLRRND